MTNKSDEFKSYPYMDDSLGLEERVDDLISRMTLKEKISQMLHSSPAIERLGICEYNWWNECLHGVARAGTATVFPQAIAMAATFSQDLMYQAGETISNEARARYHAFSKNGDRGIYKGLTFWTPNINIFRDPRWGRGHETYGEDPFLTARLGVSFVKALQGMDDNEKYLKIAACAKHYAVHSGPEGKRHHFNAIASKRDMEETYLPAFEALVKEAKVESVMGAYNRTNNEPCCGSKTLLTDILRNRYGFDGHVVSDCWAVSDFHKHHKITKTPAQSAAMAVKNGADLNCGCTFPSLLDAHKEGLIEEKDIDKAVRRLIKTRMKLGMFDSDDKVAYSKIPFSVNDCKKHNDLSEEISEKGLVLLKNDGILPVNMENIKSVAVIGPNADSRKALIGNYYGTPSEHITVLDGIRQLCSNNDIRIFYSNGCDISNEKTEGLGERADRMTEAKLIAKEADLVVLVTGLDATLEGEEGDTGNMDASGDKIDLKLPGLQNQLIKEVFEQNQNTILVNISGSAIALNYPQENIPGILQAFYPGSKGGRAIAKTIFGLNNPSGRLPVTFYESINDVPPFEDYSMENRTYKFYKGTPLYSFGYGLSYSDFEYSDLKISKEKDNILVNTKIKNASKTDGDEVCQVYVKNLKSKYRTPNFKLVAFNRFTIKAKTEIEVTLSFSQDQLMQLTEDGSKIFENGDFEIYVGSTLPDKRSLELTGKKIHVEKISL